jgi:hypothetical protein
VAGAGDRECEQRVADDDAEVRRQVEQQRQRVVLGALVDRERRGGVQALGECQT